MSERVIISLNADELAYIYEVSDAISNSNREKGRVDRGVVNAKHAGDAQRRLGLVGEYAVSRWLEVEWTNTGEKVERYDVGKYQVRTRGRHTWELYCNARRSKDAPDDVYILATSEEEGIVWIQGWAYGHEIQAYPPKDVGRYGHPSHFLPNTELHPLSTLPR